VLRVYPAAIPGPQPCLRTSVFAPSLPAGRTTTWRIGGTSGTLSRESVARAQVPLAGSRPVDLPVTASVVAPDPVAGRPGLVGLQDLELVACGTPDLPARMEP
jgi:hypothetical protein